MDLDFISLNIAKNSQNTFRSDFKSGKAIQDSQGWDFVVSSQQMRAFHVVNKS
jgi:hypothetical protein